MRRKYIKLYIIKIIKIENLIIRESYATLRIIWIKVTSCWHNYVNYLQLIYLLMYQNDSNKVFGKKRAIVSQLLFNVI